MNAKDRVRLLSGPYKTPRLKKGDRATCLVRDCDVVVVGYSKGRIAWPRCRALHLRGGSGILVEEELARAVRHESAAAVRYWWGVCGTTIVWWRKALGATRTSCEGSRRLIQANAELGGEAFKERGFTEEEIQGFRELERKHNSRRNFLAVPAGGLPVWTEEEIALLGTAPDPEIARKIGRGLKGVRSKRLNLGIPPFPHHRPK
jgi:hypothetical protein